MFNWTKSHRWRSASVTMTTDTQILKQLFIHQKWVVSHLRYIWGRLFEPSTKKAVSLRFWIESSLSSRHHRPELDIRGDCRTSWSLPYKEINHPLITIAGDKAGVGGGDLLVVLAYRTLGFKVPLTTSDCDWGASGSIRRNWWTVGAVVWAPAAAAIAAGLGWVLLITCGAPTGAVVANKTVCRAIHIWAPP